MARLPDIDSLGARPTPQSNRRITSVRNAGVVAQSAGQLGDQIAGMGGKMLEKEDRLAYAAAKSTYMKADIEARNELENDQNYGTFESRYTERMKKAEEAASGFIKSKSDRAMFAADIGVDFARGRGQVMSAAKGKEITAKKAVLLGGLETLRDVGRDALDEGTRSATINQAAEMINAAKDQGLIDPVDALGMKEKWSSDYAIEQVRMMVNRGEKRQAQEYLKTMRSVIQGEAGLRLEEDITAQIAELDMSDFVDGIMGVATNDNFSGEPIPMGDPLQGKGTGIAKGGEYEAQRKNGPHYGVDLTGKRGTPIYSGKGAGVATVGYDERSGHFVRIDHGNGLVSSYSHMDKPLVTNGQTITPDTIIGQIGMSGKTTGAHVHYRVKQNKKDIDPNAVVSGVRQSARRHDLDQLLAQVDIAADAQGWDSLKREKAKTEVARRVGRDETLVARETDEAEREASRIVGDLGDKFTSVNQLPVLVRETLRAEGKLNPYMNAAEANSKTKAPSANGGDYLEQALKAEYDPEAFKKDSLAGIVDKVTPAEFRALTVRQAKMRTEPEKGYNIRSSIASTISAYGGKNIGLNPNGTKDEQRDALRAIDDMDDYLRSRVKAGESPTDDQLKAAFKHVTRKIANPDAGPIFGKKEVEAYKVEYEDIPQADRSKIIAAYKKVNGKLPTNGEVVTTWRRTR
jgi:soluble lytic murein transglycosylase